MSDKYPGGFVTANAPTGYSVALNGSSDYLTTSGANLALGTGDFTYECWVYATSTPSDVGIFESRSSGLTGTADGFTLTAFSSSVIRIFSNGILISSSGTSYINTWCHVAVTRVSGTFNLYINGVSQGTSATSRTFSNTDAIIGAGRYGSSSAITTYFPGYISNVRIIKGTAIYTGNFTPPSQLFAVTNTQLLTCQSPTIIDNSTNNYAITVASGAKVSNFTPFAGYTGFNPALGAAAGGVWTLDEAAYYQNNRQWPIYDPYFKNTTLMLHGNGTNAAQNNTFLDSSTNNFTITRNGNTTQGSFTPFSQTGWSYYLNGSSSLDVASNSALAFGTGDFTYEIWLCDAVTPPAVASASHVIGVNATGGCLLRVFDTGIDFNVYNGSSLITYTVTRPVGTWYHLAYSRTGTTGRLFFNGVVVGTATDSTNYTSSTNFIIGSNPTTGQFYNGYVSNARVVKGTALYTSSFTPSTQPLTAVTNTSLLTGQTNRFIDNSANALAVTVRYSAPQVQAFSPFVPAYITPTTYSNWFDGSGDYLTIAGTSTACALPGDFTVEFFLNNTVTTAYGILWSTTASVDTTNGLRITTGNSNSLLQVGTALTALINSSTAFSNNTWVHIALVRSGTTLTLYQNGVSVGSVTNSQSFVSDTFSIGNATGTGSPYYLNGVLSNLRVLKGTALYTTNFTPPTAPLTNITNTSLLTCQSSTFIDNSSNNFTITATGNTVPVTSPTPFPAKVDTTTLNSAYSTSLIGGSAYFDGTGDYLNLASNAAFSLGTGDFTIETFAYYSSFTQVDAIAIINWDGGTWSANNWSLHLDHASQRGRVTFWVNNINVGSPILSSGTALVANNWYHIAVTRSGSTWRLFINGVIFASTTSSASIDGGTNPPLYIGGSGTTATQAFNGYLSGMRLVKGTALYTQAFTPPLTPPTVVSGTSLLTNFTNGAIFDSTAKNVLETVGNAQISTTQSKWGGSSMYFDGTNAYVITPSSALVSAWTGDFTVEGWFYTNSLTGGPPLWTNSTSNSDGANSLYLYTNGTLGFGKVGVNEFTSASGLWTNNQWNHAAVVRSGATVYIYLNGVSVASGAASTYIDTTVRPMTLGRQYQSSPVYYNGYIDDLRVTKGVARYITNFTPPTSQLQDQ